MLQTNRFGTGELAQIENVMKNHCASVYCVSTACMSVTSDMASWIEAGNYYRMTTISKYATAIIILGCQVTDLAILNDIKTAEKLHKINPDAEIYIGGCLAQRFDIELPEFIKRLDVARVNYQSITEGISSWLDWQKPFWISVNDWTKRYPNNDTAPGNLFRDMYPLKIGAGCHGKCKYCTIRDTRGEAYETDAYLQVQEFLDHDDVVLISDSPSIKQIMDWAQLARRYNKPISFRNVEPQTANACKDILLNLAHQGLLKIFHCPIQSNDPLLIEKMGRNVSETMQYIVWSQGLRNRGTIVATNIIIDYVADGKLYPNMDKDFLDSHFDYWTWNPYFDGNWDRKKAEERFEKYIMKGAE